MANRIAIIRSSMVDRDLDAHLNLSGEAPLALGRSEPSH